MPRAPRAHPIRLSSLLAAAVVGLAGCAGFGHHGDHRSHHGSGDGGPLVLAKQGSFFVGGRDIKSNDLSLLPAYVPSGTITIEQMYVRYQIPMHGRGRPVVLIHGCCLTGKTWEETPDGRMGWDELFVRRGHPTYVIDQTMRGRSAADPSGIVRVKGGRAGGEALPQVFGAAQEGAWAIFRFGPEYPKVFPGMQFPLEAQAEFWKQMVPDWINAQPTPNPTVPALSELARQLNGAVLVSHSQSGVYPFQTAARSTTGIAGIVSIEPGTCPAPTSDLKPYLGMPILVLWGDYVNLSPRWAPRLKLCGEFVDAVKKAGGRAEQVILNDVGFPGASHMLMQDKHSIPIGNWLAGWIDRNVGR
jgi:pimeloyl-ACP methyl ester carboxylesterase